MPDDAALVLVDRAGTEDLADVLAWLKAEHDRDDGAGFWCNREIIAESCDRGDLWVIRDDAEAVAFQVGDHAAVIACVRQDRHRRGLGAALVEASVARSYRDDVNVLMGECMPRTSFPFWRSQGFERYGDAGEFSRILVRRVLPRKHPLPPGRPLVDVVIGFYPETLTYGRSGRGVRPVAEHRLRGAIMGDGAVALERRVIGLRDDEPERRDLVVRVEVAGVERWCGKAKYEGARAAGVREGRERYSYHLDRIEPPGG